MKKILIVVALVFLLATPVFAKVIPAPERSISVGPDLIHQCTTEIVEISFDYQSNEPWALVTESGDNLEQTPFGAPYTGTFSQNIFCDESINFVFFTLSPQAASISNLAITDVTDSGADSK